MSTFTQADVAVVRGAAHKIPVVRRPIQCPDNLLGCLVLHETVEWSAESLALFDLAHRLEVHIATQCVP